MSADKIRTTVTLAHPDVVSWVREQEARGVNVQDIFTFAILEMLRLRDEVAFLRDVTRAMSGAARVATPPPPTPEPPTVGPGTYEPPTEDNEPAAPTSPTWNIAELDEYS